MVGCRYIHMQIFSYKKNITKNTLLSPLQFYRSVNDVLNWTMPIISIVLTRSLTLLFLFSSFIMAMDYFKVRYPSTPVVFDMSLVYIAVALATVLGNNLLVETFSLNSRINFGTYSTYPNLLYLKSVFIIFRVHNILPHINVRCSLWGLVGGFWFCYFLHCKLSCSRCSCCWVHR